MTTIIPPYPTVTVVMLRDWGGAKAGETASFDQPRAEYLITNAYAKAPEAPAKVERRTGPRKDRKDT